MFIRELIEVEPWWYFTAMALAVLLTGIGKSGFGGSVNVIAVPLIASVLPTQVALGVMLPILIAADVFAVWHHRGNQSWWRLRWCIGCGALGIAAGAALIFWFRSFGSNLEHQQQLLSCILSLFVAAICLVLLFFQCVRMLGGKLPRIPDTKAGAAIAGGASGFFSMIAHGGGPPMTLYLLDIRINKRLLIGTMVVFFFTINCLKTPVYVSLGWITPPALAESALWFLLVPVGSLLGVWMYKRIPQRPFNLIIYLGAAAAAANMIYKAISQWPSTSPS